MNSITTMLPSTCQMTSIQPHRIAYTEAARAWESEWICWYRFVDGGQDKVGRPGRCVLVAAFVKRDDHHDRDWSGILNSSAFQQIVTVAPTMCPLPAPASLELHWNPPPAIADSSDKIKELLRVGRSRLEGGAPFNNYLQFVEPFRRTEDLMVFLFAIMESHKFP